jgi:L-ascorbate metabolism protein UlaG (beta-lactamase superfamily)
MYMKETNFYLKPNVVLEPLVDNWYAWSHLISPATAAMNIVGRHLKIINSYIQAPHVHTAAIRNFKMRGGPFMDLGGTRVDEVKKLRDNTLNSQKQMIAFAQAVKDLNVLLKSKARGYSLDPLYKEVPEILKGYIELAYDLNNQPSFRFFEALLYASEFYNPESQSIALWLTNNDERPFMLSTPRLKENHIIQLQIPFKHQGIDALSRMKRVPGSIDQVKAILGIKPEDESLFESLFTTTPPPEYQKYTGSNVRMRYFGHACILIETCDVNILIDPLVSYYGYMHEVDRFSDMDLPDKIDYVLITHNHQDHILFETLLPLRHRIKTILVPKTAGGALQDPNLKLMFQNIGFQSVIEIGEMETVTFKDCSITGIPFLGEHCDLNIASKICHFVKIGEFTMLFAADSCNVEPQVYRNVQKMVGNADVIFLGMECDGAPLTWLYGPLLTDEISRDKDESRRLAGSNFERGKALVGEFNPLEVYVYAMGQEPWLEYISSIKYTRESNPIVQSDMLLDYCRTKQIISERLFGEKEILYSKLKMTVNA